MLHDVAALPPERMVARVADALPPSEAFVVLLGGTHAVSIGAFRAHAERGRASDVTVLQIDAHLDCATTIPTTTSATRAAMRIPA